MLASVAIAFSVQRGQELFNRNNPIISMATQTDFYDASHKYDLTKNGFKLAFGVNEFRTSMPLDDPNHVQWLVKLTHGLNQR